MVFVMHVRHNWSHGDRNVCSLVRGALVEAKEQVRVDQERRKSVTATRASCVAPSERAGSAPASEASSRPGNASASATSGGMLPAAAHISLGPAASDVHAPASVMVRPLPTRLDQSGDAPAVPV